MFKSEIVHHKGIGDRVDIPPNSLEAVLKSYRGAAEFDLISLSDGTIAVVHGADFDRQLSEMEKCDFTDLEKMKIHSEDRHSNAAVPLLGELATLASDADTRIIFDMKASSQDKAISLARQAVDQLLEIESQGGFKANPGFLKNKISLQSFSVLALKEAVKACEENHHPLLAFGLDWPKDESVALNNPLFDQTLIEEVKKSGVHDWSLIGLRLAVLNGIKEIEFDSSVITDSLIKEAHAKKIKVGTTCLDSDEKIKKHLQQLGVDYICVK